MNLLSCIKASKLFSNFCAFTSGLNEWCWGCVAPGVGDLRTLGISLRLSEEVSHTFPLP